MSFEAWVSRELELSDDEMESLHLVAAFEILVCRCEAARHRGAATPLVTASPKRAGGNSRTVTRRMLAQLGYSPAQLRVIHRLLAGSSGGWPGLLALFTTRRPLTCEQRHYARRQVRLHLDACPPVSALVPSAPADRPVPSAERAPGG